MYDLGLDHIQRPTKEVPNTEKVMADNEDLDYPPLQDISNVFAAADFSSHLSSDSAKYKRAWLKAKVIRFSVLSARECPDACSGALFIVLNYK